MVGTVKISKLKPHPRNNEFFDDICGDEWTDFLNSIKKSGVIESITITSDYTIISGHQRVRACKELGIYTIPHIFKDYDETEHLTVEDAILLDLIDSNIKQRGYGNPNKMKMARCIVELERLYGVRQGSAGNDGTNRHNKNSEGDNPHGKTQKDVADKMGITQDQIKATKKLLDLIPELQEVIESGKLSATVGCKVLAKLPKNDQLKLVEELGADKIAEMTQKQTQEYILRIKELENQPPKIIDKTDYTAIDTLKMQIKHKEKDIDALQRDKSLLEKKCKLNETDAENYKKMKSEIDFLTKQKDDIGRQIESATELAGLTVRLQNLLEQELAPIKFKRCMDVLDTCDVTRRNLTNVLEMVSSWCNEMDGLLGNKNVIVVESIEHEQSENSMPESIRIAQEMLGDTFDYDNSEAAVSETVVEANENNIVEIDSMEVRERFLRYNNKEQWLLSKFYVTENNRPQVELWRKIEKDLKVCDDNNKLLLSYDNYVEIALELKCDLSNLDRLKTRVANMIKNTESTEAHKGGH